MECDKASGWWAQDGSGAARLSLERQPPLTLMSLVLETKTFTQAAKSGPLEWGTLSCKFVLINTLILVGDPLDGSSVFS
jgi:hypothetical protein